MKFILTSILITVAIYFAIAFGLIFSQSTDDVTFTNAASEGIQFADAINADYSTLPELVKYTARDGARLGYRHYAPSMPSDRLIILVHGSSWHGMQFHKMAEAIAKAGLGHVVLPDLRGHGAEPVTRGDISHIGQLEEDMADLIAHLEKQYGKSREVVLGGHSSGGGFVIRFASGEFGHLADRLILLAPYIHHDAPTTRANSGNWAYPAIRRIIGLSMLNGVGVTSLNHLPVMRFNIPKATLEGEMGQTVTAEYSYALNTGMAPRNDYTGDLSRLTQPLLLLVGSEDEAFIAQAYEPLLSQYVKNGKYEILAGVNHIGLVFSDAAIDEMEHWIAK